MSLLAGLLLAGGPSRAAAAVSPADHAQHTFEIGEKDFLIDGQPIVLRVGEIHFARVPREYWRQRLQMCRAMGLNAVCVYLFWNFHEWDEGHYDWSGPADVAEFCRIAQEEGLWLLLRPGPYSCAEWEMGGLPWWLVKQDGIKLRSTDPRFLDPATRYLKEVGRVLGPLQITHGGPLLMVQVENEYGSYGDDPAYMGALRQALIDGGFDVPLFACNPANAIGNGFRPDLFQVVNFGKGAAQKSFETLRKYQKTGPLMNGEYYPAWFDVWGRKHATGEPGPIAADIDYMLGHRHSFSIYMAHGGTSWGLWAGADRPFLPDISSYDYDAPISEAGWVTPKFEAIRAVMQKHLESGETLPEPPPHAPVINIDPFSLSGVEPVVGTLSLLKMHQDDEPRTMEFYDQSRGAMVYRTTLPAGPAGRLSVKEMHDFAWVTVDGKPAGIMDRRSRNFWVTIPARTRPAQVDLLVHTMGRVNFGQEVFDRKGLHGPVTFTPGDGGAPTEVRGWKIYSLPLDDKELSSLHFAPVTAKVVADRVASGSLGAAFWRGTFNVSQPGDTFVDLRDCGFGVIWVNGHCLGRYWNIGPSQTAYLPGVWLHEGSNELVLLDYLPRTTVPKLAGLAKPILAELRPELDFARPTRAKGEFSLDGITPAASGTFRPDADWQVVTFSAPARGRYLCLESVNAYNDQPFASAAELDALGADGSVVSKAGWKVLWASSEEISAEGGYADNVLDGQSNTFWHTQYTGAKPGHPHRIVIDLGASQPLTGVRYLGRPGDGTQPGRIRDYRVYLSDKPFGLQAGD